MLARLFDPNNRRGRTVRILTSASKGRRSRDASPESTGDALARIVAEGPDMHLAWNGDSSNDSRSISNLAVSLPHSKQFLKLQRAHMCAVAVLWYENGVRAIYRRFDLYRDEETHEAGIYIA